MNKLFHLNLGVKLILMLAFFMIIMAVSICGIVAYQYSESMKTEYFNKAYSYCNVGAMLIDGDTIARYVETGKTDEYYDRIQEELTTIAREGGLMYYYVFVPKENSLVYVWDSGEGMDGNEETALGYEEEYMEGGKENTFKAFSKNPEIEMTIARDERYGYIATAMAPLLDSYDNPVALVGVDLSMEDIITDIRSFQILVVSIMFVIFIMISFVVYISFKTILIRPIITLKSATDSIMEHMDDLRNFNVDLHTGDEIDDVARSFENMALRLDDYMNDLASATAEKERVARDLSLATRIQASMLPCIFPPFPDRTEFSIYALMHPAKEVGGDFYDFFFVDSDHLALVIADVSGKGVPAALFMMIAKALIKSNAQLGLSPKAVMEKVNNSLCENNNAEMFVTVYLALYEISTGRVVSVNAGHENPIIEKDGVFEVVEEHHGLVCAGMEGVRYKESEMVLESGQALFLYTDGVAEANNREGEEFGVDRLLDSLNRNPMGSPDELISGIRADIENFVLGADQFDDITMLCIRRNN